MRFAIRTCTLEEVQTATRLLITEKGGIDKWKISTNTFLYPYICLGYSSYKPNDISGHHRPEDILSHGITIYTFSDFTSLLFGGK